MLNASDLAEDAYEIAVNGKIAFYDALFLAVAEKEQVAALDPR